MNLPFPRAPEIQLTHSESDWLLQQVQRSLAAGSLAHAGATFERLVEHAEDRFAREQHWMALCGLPESDAHALEHLEIMQLMRQLLRLLRDDDRWDLLGVAVRELRAWFGDHAMTWDARLAGHLACVGACRAAATGASMRAVARR